MNSDPCFALLDDHQSRAAQPSARLCTDFVREWCCDDPASLEATWSRAEADMAGGLHAVLVIDYEWGAKLQRVAAAVTPGRLRVLMFRTQQRLSAREVDDWLDTQGADNAAGVADLRPTVDEAAHAAAIARIHALISDGETYQLNFTHRLRGQAFGTPLALYRRLRARQPVPFGALIRLPPEGSDRDAAEPEWLLSCSPELFVQHRAGQLEARPMKGTAARAANPEQDESQRRWLQQDAKNRAENLMIVDLLRNDLGRVARTGTVRVPALFAVESHASVHQMTSTVQAERAPDASFPALLRALFPCGSITGAPKRQTMRHIAALEDTPRGVYTGAIGWVEAPRAGEACGDFCLSVAIRTLLLGPEQPSGWRPAELGVGGGIVLDSQPAAEWAETRAKALFLTGLDPGFTLFETLHAQRGQPPRRMAAHFRRLQSSAAWFGFRCDIAGIAQALAEHIATWPDIAPRRLRLDLAHDGRIRFSSSPLAAAPPGPVHLRLAAQPLPLHERALAGHKTSQRAGYDAALREAEAAGCFDTLFCNPRGELTEGARSSLFLRLDGRWFTPALSAGLLPGVMRARLLARPGFAQEAVLTRADLRRAEALMVCNSLRGLLPARLAEPAA